MTENKENDKPERIHYANFAFPKFGHFPKDKWEEYNKDVQENYGNIRWVKAWHDHLVAKQASKEEAMWALILQLKKEVELIKMQSIDGHVEKAEEEEVVKTLGRGNEDA